MQPFYSKHCLFRSLSAICVRNCNCPCRFKPFATSRLKTNNNVSSRNIKIRLPFVSMHYVCNLRFSFFSSSIVRVITTNCLADFDYFPNGFKGKMKWMKINLPWRRNIDLRLFGKKGKKNWMKKEYLRREEFQNLIWTQQNMQRRACYSDTCDMRLTVHERANF